jgi:hypothetical protein
VIWVSWLLASLVVLGDPVLGLWVFYVAGFLANRVIPRVSVLLVPRGSSACGTAR